MEGLSLWDAGCCIRRIECTIHHLGHFSLSCCFLFLCRLLQTTLGWSLKAEDIHWPLWRLKMAIIFKMVAMRWLPMLASLRNYCLLVVSPSGPLYAFGTHFVMSTLGPVSECSCFYFVHAIFFVQSNGLKPDFHIRCISGKSDAFEINPCCWHGLEKMFGGESLSSSLYLILLIKGIHILLER